MVRAHYIPQRIGRSEADLVLSNLCTRLRQFRHHIIRLPRSAIAHHVYVLFLSSKCFGLMRSYVFGRPVQMGVGSQGRTSQEKGNKKITEPIGRIKTRTERRWKYQSLTLFMIYSARNRREVKLPVHYSFAQHQRRWQTEDYVRLDQDQGCWSSLLQLGLQEGRC
jgi:hypothetical protein